MGFLSPLLFLTIIPGLGWWLRSLEIPICLRGGVSWFLSGGARDTKQGREQKEEKDETAEEEREVQRVYEREKDARYIRTHHTHTHTHTYYTRTPSGSSLGKCSPSTTHAVLSMGGYIYTDTFCRTFYTPCITEGESFMDHICMHVLMTRIYAWMGNETMFLRHAHKPNNDSLFCRSGFRRSSATGPTNCHRSREAHCGGGGGGLRRE